MNSTEKGNLTELKVAVRLLEKGYVVLRAFGDGCRYDILIDHEGKFSRIQCKTGRYRKGAVVFNTVSTYSWKKQVKCYDGQIEFFGVYCPAIDKIYLVPISKVAKGKTSLRFDPPKNSQVKNLLFAAQFEI